MQSPSSQCTLKVVLPSNQGSFTLHPDNVHISIADLTRRVLVTCQKNNIQHYSDVDPGAYGLLDLRQGMVLTPTAQLLHCIPVDSEPPPPPPPPPVRRDTPPPPPPLNIQLHQQPPLTHNQSAPFSPPSPTGLDAGYNPFRLRRNTTSSSLSSSSFSPGSPKLCAPSMAPGSALGLSSPKVSASSRKGFLSEALNLSNKPLYMELMLISFLGGSASIPIQEEPQPETVLNPRSKDDEPCLEFTEDSPFFRQNLEETERKTKSLGDHIKLIHDAGKKYTQVSATYSEACAQLSHALLSSWDDVEQEPSADVSLGMGMSKMSSVVERYRHLVEELSTSLNKFFSKLDHFRLQILKPSKQDTKHFQQAVQRYESSLHTFLMTKRPKPKKHQRRNSLTAGKADDELFQDIQIFRKNSETLRLSHTCNLNRIFWQERVELMQTCITGFQCFFEHFQKCHQLQQDMQPYVSALDTMALAKKSMLEEKCRVFESESTAYSRELFHISRSGWSGTTAVMDEKQSNFSDITLQGYLCKQSASVRKDWKRRWFVLEDGQLFYIRSHKDTKREPVVSVMQAAPRVLEEAELRNCFCIRTMQQRVYILQAESWTDMHRWIQAIVNFQHSTLNQTQDTKGPQMSAETRARVEEEKKVILAKLMQLNPTCCDCGQANPEWVSINLGVMMCIACSGVHRSIGVHISKVRSLMLDTLEPNLYEFLQSMSNSTVNELYEHRLSTDLELSAEYPKPRPDSEPATRDRFIRAKYEARLFLNRQLFDSQRGDADYLGRMLLHAASVNDLQAVLAALAFQVDPDYSNGLDQRTALHIAAQYNFVSCMELLLQNGARHTSTDIQGDTPLQLAQKHNAEDAVRVLLKKSARPSTCSSPIPLSPLPPL